MTKLPHSRPAKASGHGAVHWMMQRVTAVALVLLVILSIGFYTSSVYQGVAASAVFGSPFRGLIGILLFSTAFYHSYLGLKVIIEDYVSCPCGRTIAVNIVRFINIAMAVAVTVAIILMIIDERISVLA